MMEMEEKKLTNGEKLIIAIRERKILKDNRPNHGLDFYGGYEELYRQRFHNYLGSCSRYLENKRLNVREYHG
ncbi:hypothetical protein [Eubacterium sp. MSJ-33]|uniref:hypothetical protein n=1 Tax=Eubacterium sp. MSJ-33 TaxID=2841528 RepID=UPI001C746566|nr:hypothetical protein [Eubacterium sp. MSJ-33]QWT52204.1 hypothetical protein KP625_08880 [Eubacterium sp. MSJ-33]